MPNPPADVRDPGVAALLGLLALGSWAVDDVEYLPASLRRPLGPSLTGRQISKESSAIKSPH
jgi:hypothetical protein